MDEITGYQQLTPIFESLHTVVYRCRRMHDNRPVIIKVIHSSTDTTSVTSYQREYKILNHLRGRSGVVAVYDLKRTADHLILEVEDIEGISLQELLHSRPISLSEALQIAMKTVKALGEIHAAGVIHNALNPIHVIYNASTGVVKLICFRIATILSYENPTLSSKLEGVLAYISPEQTGRMNRSVDFRSDFYALGCTLYELLSGNPPFCTSDPMEMVHAHLAKRPIPLCEVNNSVPAVLSTLVGKLLAKNAEERYQSAWGIYADLEECSRQWETHGFIAEFALAQKDFSDSFHIPEKIYGRNAEIATLLTTFDRVSKGGREFLLVSGYSGVGKSCLVQEIHKPIARQHGFFIKGKFDQFQKNIPYSALITAFRGLIRQLLTGSEQQLAHWRRRMNHVFGQNGQIILDVLPEVAMIVGPQPLLRDLPASEAKNRFNHVFQEFIRLFCQADHPLVIFLDDLQWADAGTLKLIELLLTDTGANHLFVIGAYRDNEVDGDHPFSLTLDKLAKEGVEVQSIALDPLKLAPITALLADTLHRGPDEVSSLAELVLHKTGGNPFFVNQFLLTLHQEGWLSFERQDGVTHRWHWSLQDIAKLDFTENVVDLVVSKLLRLPKTSQAALRLASCIGNHFDLHTLSIIHEKSEANTYEDLLPAIRQGFILTTSELSSSEQQQTELVVLNYRFLHDRVQQAAYALINNSAKQEVHLKIGRLLWCNLTSAEQTERVFELADHFNKGAALIKTDLDRLPLLKLNHTACRKAKASTAFNSALRYLRHAMEACSAENTDRAQRFTLHKELAELEYLNGHYDLSEQSIERALNLADSAVEQVEVYNLQLVQYTLLGKHAEVITLGRMALQLLDIQVPETDLKEAVHLELRAAKASLGNREIASLINAPIMTQPEQLAAMKLLNDLTPAAYFYNTEIYSWVQTKMSNLSLQFGLAPESGKGFTSYGNVLAYELGAYQEGYEFGMVGLRLCEEQNHKAYVCRCCFVLTTFLTHWVQPLQVNNTLAEDGFRSGLESGEVLYAGYIQAFNTVMNGFFQGKNLIELQTALTRHFPFVEKTNNRLALNIMMAFQAVIPHLREDDTAYPQVAGCDPMSDASPWKNDTSPTVIGVWHVLQSMLHYIYGDYAKALHWSREVQAHHTFINGTTAPIAHTFFTALSIAACYHEASSEQQRAYWNELIALRQRLRQWQDSCPHNFDHRLFLVEAEMARLTNNMESAINFYDRSILAAKSNGFIHGEAVANERVALFWLDKGKESFSRIYMKQAVECYQTWGAKRKIRQLEGRYPQFFQGSASHAQARAETTISHNENALDLNTVLKASQAISGEIKLDSLLRKMMDILMTSAGAEKGSLILKHKEQLVVEVQAQAGQEMQYPGIAAKLCRNLPLAVLLYVTRTNQEILIDNAVNEPLFAHDRYIIDTAPKSVLCIPIVNHGNLSGLLYLENNQAIGAFTSDRVALLKMLSAQAAISLENARFYDSLKASEEKFRLLYENAIEGIFQTTPNGVLKNANPAMARILGFNSPGELLEQRAHSQAEWFVDQSRHEIFLQTIHNEGWISDFEAQFMGKDSSPIWISISAQTRRDASGQIEQIEGSLLDIRERKEREHAERMRQDAENATLAKSQFLANMSHEIRTPMNAITGMTYLALKTELSEQQRDYLNKIQTASNALLAVINDILDFSKIEAGKLSMETVDFDLESVLENLSNLFAYKSQEKGLEFLLACPTTIPSVLVGDPFRLGQVLINLTGNAIKFTAKGEVLVAVELVSETNDELTLRFKVRDTGIGLSEKEIANLFQSFSQADLSTTRKFGGTGLGLAISKKLVEMMRGEIGVASTPNQGSTFFFTATFGRGAEEFSTMTPDPKLAGRRILVVDDSVEARQILCDMLTGLSFQPKGASSGAEAIAELQRMDAISPYDLVLMDWRMPELDGIETTRRIRTELGLTNIPTVFMVTAYGLEEIKKEAEEVGIETLLLKPVRPSTLFDAIMGVFSRPVASRRRESRPSTDSLNFAGHRVLLVEDNPINQLVATKILEGVGFHVTVAENGVRAVATVLEHPFTLVLMDIQMPEMDGYQATREIRKHPQFNDLPIIAMTAHAIDGERERCIAAGMNEHISKPIHPETLFRTLATWLKVADQPVATVVAPESEPPPDEKVLPDHLPGFDLAEGMERLGNNQTLYRMLLMDFRQRYQLANENIHQALADNDILQAERMAHTIKGASGNLSATDLYQTSTALEKVLRSGGNYQEPLRLFSSALQNVLTVLQYLEAKPKEWESVTIVDQASRDTMIHELFQQLSEGSIEAVDSIPRLRQYLDNEHHELLTTLTRQIEAFQFYEAEESLRALSQAVTRQEKPHG